MTNRIKKSAKAKLKHARQSATLITECLDTLEEEFDSGKMEKLVMASHALIQHVHEYNAYRNSYLASEEME